MRLAVILLVTTTVFAQQQEACVPAGGRSVSVTGDATIGVVPDRVAFTVGVETRSMSVSDAFRRNTEKANAVIAALKERGVKPEEIQTSRYTIDREGRVAGYRVTNLVTVTRENLDDAGELLQLAVSKGANEAGGLHFLVSNERAAVLRGLEAAFTDARIKAEKLAALAGKQLGDVVCLNEHGMIAPRARIAESVTVSSDAMPAIEAGEQQYTFRVSATFELR
jgi:uncharacterized protein